MLKGDDPMIAKHLFIFKDAFNQDEQITEGAQALEIKYGAKSYSTYTLWIDPTQEKIITDDCKQSTNPLNSKNNFPNCVGVYLISHGNTPFALKGAKGIADMICDYLDTREDLDINCTKLDKVVLATCGGAEGLKTKFHDEKIISKITAKLKPANRQSQENFAERYAQVSVPWNEKRQEALDKNVTEYEADSDSYFSIGRDYTMVTFACALDQRGAHPKIAAWESGLYVRADGSKSIWAVFGDPVLSHERLLNKMMIQFNRTGNGPGSIRQLQLHEWSDKRN
jgi:hypothetical protein